MSNHSHHSSASMKPANRNLHNIARVILILTLVVAMVIPASVPMEVFAATMTGTTAQSSQGDDDSQTSQSNSGHTAQSSQSNNAQSGQDAQTSDNAAGSTSGSVSMSRTQTISGMNLFFMRSVISDERLSMAPSNLIADGKRNSIKLTWEGVEAPAGIIGYIVLRREPDTDTWNRIASVDSSTNTFTDEEASEKDVLYSYVVVAYKHVNGRTMISVPTEWAAAVTSRSSGKNVEQCKVTNLANVVSVMVGSYAKVELKFPDKAYSTEMRWSSSNSSIATVDDQGTINGVKTGSATIYARSHTGAVTSFDIHITTPGSAQAMIDTFTAWMGYNRINGYQNGIIDIYNSVTPWPQGYKMRYSDAWCDATITAAAIKTGNVERIGRECSVPRHIDIFRKLGIWEEDGTIVPKPGDIIVYSWSRFRQPNNASASHIGLVVKVEGKQITCIEGNRGIGVVDTRTIPVGWGCIRGYARPNYAN